MLGQYNHSQRRPWTAQPPRSEYTNDYFVNERPRSSRINDVRITDDVNKYCADLHFEKTVLQHENYRLKNRVEIMLKNKETEVWNEVSITLDELYRENSILKEKLSVEERKRLSKINNIPCDPVANIRGRYYRSLEENAEIERKLRCKENEVWDLKKSLEDTKLKLKWVEEDLKTKEYDARNTMKKIFEEEIKYNRCLIELKESKKQCETFWASYQKLANENIILKRELEEQRRSLFPRNEFFPHELHNELQSIKEENQKLKDKIKEQDNRIIAILSLLDSCMGKLKQDRQYSFATKKDDVEMKKRLDDLKKENTRLLQEKREMTEKHLVAFHQKESELLAVRWSLENKETELNSLRLRLEKEEKTNLQLSKERSDYLYLKRENETEKLKRENSSLEKIVRECLESFEDTEKKWKRSSAHILFLEKENQQLKDQMSNLKRGEVLQGLHSDMETEVIKRLKDEISTKEKEIRRLQESIKTEERKSAQLQNNFSEDSKRKDSLLKRNDRDLQELIQQNQRLQNEVIRLNSEKSRQQESVIHTEKFNAIKRELDTKRKEIDSLHEKIRELENENMLLQKETDPLSKDRNNSDARNSNAADEVKILQTEVEEKQREIQRLRDKCKLDEKETKELLKNYSEVSEERDNLLKRNQRLQGELNELHARIRHLEENRMKTSDDLNYLKEIKDTVAQLRNDNDRLEHNIATLSKEKENALLRISVAESEVSQLRFDIKSRGEEIQRLQKQIAQKDEHIEKVQESFANITHEKQKLLESNKRLEQMDGQMLLAMDESKRFQEKIKELQNENRHLRQNMDDLSKQKDDAIKRIRNLENGSSKNDDQLALARDESKRLQGRIKELQSENSRLRHEIDGLSKQKEDALTRLSKVAGAKLTHGNAAITDLSDTDRPTKLAEKFSELYDNAWTDAYEELDNTFHNEEETIKVLLRIFQEAYEFCVQTENNYEMRIGQAVFTLANETGSRQIPSANVEIQKVLADLRISLSTACCSVVEEMLLSKLPSIVKSVDVAACPLTKLFARQCASLCWRMRIRDPPLFVRFEFRCGATFNSDVLKRYTKTGGYLDFLVWPALYLHEKGPVLAKGVAQPKIAP